MLKCKRCNKEWDNIEPNPKQCPNCKSYYWNKEREWVKVEKKEEIKS